MDLDGSRSALPVLRADQLTVPGYSRAEDEELRTFFSATNMATFGFWPGERLTLVTPSRRTLSTMPADQSRGLYTWTSLVTHRIALDSSDVYWRCLRVPGFAVSIPLGAEQPIDTSTDQFSIDFCEKPAIS